MEIPNNTNTSRLCDLCLMDLRLGRLSNNESRNQYDKDINLLEVCLILGI